MKSRGKTTEETTGKVILFAAIVLGCFGLNAQQTGQTAPKPDDRPLACQSLDPEIFPPQTCTVALTYMSPADDLGLVSEDGSFMVLSPLPNGKYGVKTLQFPPKLRSEIALNCIKLTIVDLRSIQDLDKNPNNAFTKMLPSGIDLWQRVRDIYCYYNPNASYVDLSGQNTKCLDTLHISDEQTVEDELAGVQIFRANYKTFASDPNMF